VLAARYPVFIRDAFVGEAAGSNFMTYDRR
jgi:hypothetical protein